MPAGRRISFNFDNAFTDYQEQILRDPARYTITEAATKVGKTYSHLLWLLIQSLKGKNGYNYWWIAPVYSQAKIAFRRLKRYLIPYGEFKFNDSSLEVFTPKQTSISFRTADKPDHLYGDDVYAIVFDEATRSKEEAWHALRTTITKTKGKVKLIGNYTGDTNWVHRLAEENKDNPDYSYYLIDIDKAVDAGIIDPEEVEKARKDLPPSMFNALYYCKGNVDGARIIGNEEIEAIFTHRVPPGYKYISADLAHLGKDLMVIMVWDGMNMIQMEQFEKTSAPQAVAYIKEYQKQHKVANNRIIVDSDGLGSTQADYLKDCTRFRGGERATRDGFQNMRADCYFKLADLIRENKIYVSLDGKRKARLIEELKQIKVKDIDYENKMAIVAKDKIRNAIGRSPDYADALMMRMYYEVSKPPTPHFQVV